MCRWMGSHFRDWSDYNGVAFSIDLVEWGPITRTTEAIKLPFFLSYGLDL